MGRTRRGRARRSVLAYSVLVVSLVASGCLGGDDDGDTGVMGNEDEQRPKAETTVPPRAQGSGAALPPAREAPKRANEEVAQRYLELARKAASLPQSAEAGCQQVRVPTGRRRASARPPTGGTYWAPPTPRASARLGDDNQVVISFEFERMPKSPACRPQWIDVWISGYGVSRVAGSNKRTYRVTPKQRFAARKRGTVTVSLPRGWQRPYTARVSVATVDERATRQHAVPVR